MLKWINIKSFIKRKSKTIYDEQMQNWQTLKTKDIQLSWLFQWKKKQVLPFPSTVMFYGISK